VCPALRRAGERVGIVFAVCHHKSNRVGDRFLESPHINNSPAIGDNPPFGRFFLPGPTEVHPDVLHAQNRPMIGHRGPAIKELIGELQTGLQDLFCTQSPVLISTSSATGLMEAAVRNGARSRVLSLVNGAFSQRFGEIAEACGLEVETLEVGWGEIVTAGQLRDRLATGDFDAVTVVHSETSTGALNPIRELSEVVREQDDVVLLVDSVTGVGGAELQTDEWALDFVLTGSQKALALPPGLAFGVASERLMARSAKAKRKGVYFDLVSFRKQLDLLQTPNTPAVSLFYAAAKQLERIRIEGLEARWDRHRAMADRCAEWVDTMREEKDVALSVLAPEGSRSPTVTCVALPEGTTGPSVVSAMKERGFTIGGGYGKLKETAFRVGHMGDHTVAELDAVLDALGEVLS
jgi:aspartate aminotransferase-like enzyme